MKHFFFLLLFCPLLVFGQTHQSFHDFKVKNIFGDTISLSDYAGKRLLVVNTASFCGYTYQFTKLRQLDSMYQSYNFRVIGFPSNDFGGQDPYADSTIFSFCLNEYAIEFPMMSRISIRTGDTSVVYKWLQRKSRNGVANAQVAWNFNKFLIDENGNWVRHFPSPTQPNDTAITNWIKRPFVTRTSDPTAEKTSVFQVLENGSSQPRLKVDFPELVGQLRLLGVNGQVYELHPAPSLAFPSLQTGIFQVEARLKNGRIQRCRMVKL